MTHPFRFARALVAALLFAAAPARADDYPDRTITMVVPFAAGGLSDVPARIMAAMLADRIHQPYRAALCPLLPALEKLAGASGVRGVALSGAGPSVLIFLDAKASLSRVKARVTEHLRSVGLSAELIATAICGYSNAAKRR